MSVADAAKPSYQLSGPSRLLVLKLHDGKLAAKGVEWRGSIGGLSDTTLPGSKVGGSGLLLRGKGALPAKGVQWRGSLPA